MIDSLSPQNARQEITIVLRDKDGNIKENKKLIFKENELIKGEFI